MRHSSGKFLKVVPLVSGTVYSLLDDETPTSLWWFRFDRFECRFAQGLQQVEKTAKKQGQVLRFAFLEFDKARLDRSKKQGQVLRFAFLEFDKARLDRSTKFTKVRHPNRLDAVDAILNG